MAEAREEHVHERDIPQRHQPEEGMNPPEWGPHPPEPLTSEAATREAWREWSEHAGSDSVLQEDRPEKRDGDKAA